MFMGTFGNLVNTSSKVGIRYPFELQVMPYGAKLSSISFLNEGKSLSA